MKEASPALFIKLGTMKASQYKSTDFTVTSPSDLKAL